MQDAKNVKQRQFSQSESCRCLCMYSVCFYDFYMLIIAKHSQYLTDIFSQFSVYHFSTIFSFNNSDYLQKARKYGHFTGYKN